MSIINDIENELLEINQKYIDESIDGYDFWNQHIKYVLREARELASRCNADMEIVELGAILHDIALVSKVGTKADHHHNGVILARELLSRYNYPLDRMDRVLGCIQNHRSSKNATNIEEMCVADADIIAHFYNITSSFVIGVKKFGYDKPQQFMEWLSKDYEDMSDTTKVLFKDRYNNIMKVLFADNWEEI